MPDAESPYREALILWLRWNAAYEQVTAQMFEAHQSINKLEDYLDSLDQLRKEAVAFSHRLLD